jgi:hypothetical protein
MVSFKIGDKVEVFFAEKGNFVQPGSYGIIIPDGPEKESADSLAGEEQYHIDYTEITDELGRVHTENDLHATDNLKGHYYTVKSRVRLMFKDWEDRIKKVKNYEG